MATTTMMSQNNMMTSENRNANHSMPPSKVLHCRAVCDGCTEQDLVQTVRRFGNVTAIRLIPSKFQALVEFESLESAIACVAYSKFESLVIRNRVMYVNFSKSSEISRTFNDTSKGQQPTHILLMTIINVIHPVNVDTIKKICQQQNVEVQRIVFFHKNGLQALVEFISVMDASHIQKSLNGCDIYPGCCTLKIEFSNSKKLNVHSNTDEHYNIDVTDNKFGLAPEMDTRDGKFGHPNKPRGLFDKPEFSNSGYDSSFQGRWDGGYMGAGQPNYSGQSMPPNYSGQSMPPNYSGEPGQSNYLDQYASPFANGGGEGCVAMVFGINNEVMNCDHLFNLFSLYGNVIRVKVLLKKPGGAMVQYDSKMSTEMAIQNLNGVKVFGKVLDVIYSKHPGIVTAGPPKTLFDGSPATVEFHESRNNRFKHVPGGRNDIFSMIHPPSVVLHYFNAPAESSKERLETLFEQHGAEVPLKHLAIRKSSNKSTSGLLEFSSISKAVEALILVNYATLYKLDHNMDEMKRSPFTFKLAFSTSQSINNGDEG